MKAIHILALFIAIMAGCSRRAPETKRIEILSQGISVDGVLEDEVKLRGKFMKECSERGFFPVLLIAPRNCLYERLENILDLLSSVGVWNLQFALSDSVNEQVYFIPHLVESVHVPWHEVTAFIAGESVIITTNLQEKEINTEAKHIRFNATPETTADELFAHLRSWQSRKTNITRDKTILIEQGDGD